MQQILPVMRITFLGIALFSIQMLWAQVNVDKSIGLMGPTGNAGITGIKDVGSSTSAVSVEALQKGGLIYGTSTSYDAPNNRYSVTVSPALSGYSTGMILNFKADLPNTGPGVAKLKVGALADVPIKKDVSSNLANNDILANQMISVIYDGTNFQLLSRIFDANSGGTVTQVGTGTGLTGGPINGSGTISLANTAVSPSTYGSATQVASFTVDQQGRLTSASNTPISGLLPAGSTAQTLRHDGANWASSSVLTNNGTSVGIGMTAASGQMLDISSGMGGVGNSAIRALYPGGGQLTGTEFGALAYRNGEWSAVYAKAGTGSAIALSTDGEVNMLNGNVGIGTATPQAKFHLITTANSSSIEWQAILNNPNNSATSGYGVGLRLQNSDLLSGGNETHKWVGVAAQGNGAYSNQTDMVFYTNNFNSGANATSAPTERMRITGSTNGAGGNVELTGKLKATQLDIATGAVINLHLSQCSGGACPGYHPLGQWTNVSAQGYSWTVSQNTASDVFTHNGQGTVTINKTGTYQIRLYGMSMPQSTNMSWVMQLVPAINGNPDGFPSSGNPQLNHGYYPAGWWARTVSVFTRNLSAGATVGYSWYPEGAMTYWAHDGYTGFEIVRIN